MQEASSRTTTLECPPWCVDHSYTDVGEMGDGADWVTHDGAPFALPMSEGVASLTRTVYGPTTEAAPDAFDGVSFLVEAGTGYAAEFTFDQMEAFALQLLERVRELREAAATG